MDQAVADIRASKETRGRKEKMRQVLGGPRTLQEHLFLQGNSPLGDDEQAI